MSVGWDLVRAGRGESTRSREREREGDITIQSTQIACVRERICGCVCMRMLRVCVAGTAARTRPWRGHPKGMRGNSGKRSSGHA